MANDDARCDKNIFVRSVKWLPVLFILSIVGWSYYAYVFELCLSMVTSALKRTIYLSCYHKFVVMFVWSYFQTMFTKPGKVPDMFKLSEVECELLMRAETKKMQHQILQNFAKKLPVNNRTVNGGIRYCDKCKNVKPDRAHHCSVCGSCVLKMDHHCPWVNNCVSFTNYKFFILFLGYSFVYCVFILMTVLPHCISYWKGETVGVLKIQVLFLFFVSAMFAISLASLLAYHMYLILYNRTTLEAFRAPTFRHGADPNAYNLDRRENAAEIFGKSCLKWILPIGKPLGNGYVFRQREVHEDSERLLQRGRTWSEESTNN